MERISDVYEMPKNAEFIQCDNPIHNDNPNHNDNISHLILIEESINRALINSNENLNDNGYSKTYKIVYLGVLFCILIIVSLIAYFLFKSN
jgi:hypothetical protein